MLRKSIGTFQALPRRRDFTFLPGFFSLAEQRVLLTTTLQKLDAMEGIQSRRRRRRCFELVDQYFHLVHRIPSKIFFSPTNTTNFRRYSIQRSRPNRIGHFDGVIKNYREMHLTSWPTSDVPGLPSILDRLQALYPSQDVQTHLLHLASNGGINPHVDNLSASGSWILGVSLGSERLLCLESQDGNSDSFQVLLPSGSVYIQRDSLRFDYKHSIPIRGAYEGREILGGQRLSIMIRDRLPSSVPKN
ncbi:hypothetical protein B0H16DRAFT_1514347 [Mycena metata]|uniref:Alpha-ketoglutarate-dependent dioxygenase AlkB-like domain-containing protein n=1 Tax=Mycena metata TaxID=1033252 RepID=A0AAD7JTR6_9AGAR|nr:hypothetical protein B0H16DRAFT_1514347 [Mycena metata]